MYKFSILFTSLILLYSCSGGSGNDTIPTQSSDDYNRVECLTNIYDNIAIPAFEDLQNKINTLETSSSNFINNPTDVSLLNKLRTDWYEAYCSWQYVEVFSHYGIGEEILYGFKMNTYPTDVNRTHNIIDGIAQFNPAYLDNQGFPALEYLMYGIASSDEEILKTLNNANALSLITNIVAEMKNNSTSSLAWWNNNKTSIVNDNSSTATSSLNLLLNDFIYYFEKGFRTNKFGIPSGYFSGGQIFPNKTEGYYATNISKSLALHSKNSISKLYEGISYNDNSNVGESFYSYLLYLQETTLANEILNKFDEIEGSINNLDSDLATQIQSNNEEVLNTFNLIQSAVALLKVEMTAALGVGIDYISGDGD